jgi:hypothetical protein
MAPGNSAVDPVFMLQANQVVAIEIEKVSRPLVRSEIVLSQFKTDLLRVIVACIGIVYGNCKETFRTVFRGDGSAEVGSESCYAALPGQSNFQQKLCG